MDASLVHDAAVNAVGRGGASGGVALRIVRNWVLTRTGARGRLQPPCHTEISPWKFAKQLGSNPSTATHPRYIATSTNYNIINRTQCHSVSEVHTMLGN